MYEARADLSFEKVDCPNESVVGFMKSDFIVYPAHGVGQISAIEVHSVAETSLEFFVIYFPKSKMTARGPTQKAASIGMRRLSCPAAIEQVRRTLKQPAKKGRANWTRSNKEYEMKIKSGTIVALAEVMRDLHRRTAGFEQSYSERQFYVVARDRLSAEVALVTHTNEESVVLELENLLMSRVGANEPLLSEARRGSGEH